MHAALDYPQPRSAWMPRTLARPLFKRLARLALWSLGALGLSWVMPPLLGDTQVVNSISIARPPGEVFDFATTPAHWPSWHPASLEVEGAIKHSTTLAKK